MPVELPPDLMVSVSGVRGRVGEPLTPELMAGIAASFGAYLRDEHGGGPVLVGRDSRTSGPMYARAVAAGLQSVGSDVVDLGLVPTPSLLLAVREAGAAGGIGVTASHNPAEWNALKLVSGEGIFLDAEQSRAFRARLAAEDPPRAPWDGLGEYRKDEGAVARHLRRILDLDLLDVEALEARCFRVALDCVHGAGGVIMPGLLEALGCEVTVLGGEPDGLFPRDPEPRADNLGALSDTVRECGAELGLAVDPDVDRLSLVDGAGTALGEDLTLALASAAVLSRTPGTVVTNLSTSRVVEDVAGHYGGTLVRAPVGEVNVARRMQSEEAVVGGEGNGGVILPALHMTRDAPVAAALILQHLLDEDTSLAEAAGRWPSYHIVKEKVSFDREALAGAYEALEEALRAPERDTSDGLRLSWPGKRAWLHVRPSGTEPVVRLIAEAPGEEEARALVKGAGEVLEGIA